MNDNKDAKKQLPLSIADRFLDEQNKELTLREKELE